MDRLDERWRPPVFWPGVEDFFPELQHRFWISTIHILCHRTWWDVLHRPWVSPSQTPICHRRRTMKDPGRARESRTGRRLVVGPEPSSLPHLLLHSWHSRWFAWIFAGSDVHKYCYLENLCTHPAGINRHSWTCHRSSQTNPAIVATYSHKLPTLLWSAAGKDICSIQWRPRLSEANLHFLYHASIFKKPTFQL